MGTGKVKEGAGSQLLLRDGFMAMKCSATGRDTGKSRATRNTRTRVVEKQHGVPVGRWEYIIKIALREVDCELRGFNSLRIWVGVAEKCFI